MRAGVGPQRGRRGGRGELSRRLATANSADAKNIRGKVLVLHGGDDPHVSTKEVEAFEGEMRAVGVDWQVVAYGGAVHAFTNPPPATTSPAGPPTTPPPTDARGRL